MLKDLSREQLFIILGLVLVIIAGLSVMAYRRLAVDGSEEIVIEEPEQGLREVGVGKAVVHVTGAVRHEGVYRLRLGDRVIDALELAGGAAPDADLSSINLAEKVKDGQKVIVPVKRKVVERASGDPVIQGSGTSSDKIDASGKVSINSADEKELCKVQGVGPKTAKSIIEYRESNGPFTRIEDVMEVKGIGKGKFNKIKDQIII